MPDTTIEDPTTVPPVITATSHITGIRRAEVTQLEHEQVAISYIGTTGANITIAGPHAELRAINETIARQLDIIRRSGPSH